MHMDCHLEGRAIMRRAASFLWIEGNSSAAFGLKFPTAFGSFMKTSRLDTASVQVPQDAQVLEGPTSVNLQASALERGGSCQVRSVPKFLQFSLDLFSTLENKNRKKAATHLLITALFDCIKSPSFSLILVTLRILLLAEEIFCIALPWYGSLLSYNVEEFYVLVWCSRFQPVEEI